MKSSADLIFSSSSVTSARQLLLYLRLQSPSRFSFPWNLRVATARKTSNTSTKSRMAFNKCTNSFKRKALKHKNSLRKLSILRCWEESFLITSCKENVVIKRILLVWFSVVIGWRVSRNLPASNAGSEAWLMHKIPLRYDWLVWLSSNRWQKATHRTCQRLFPALSTGWNKYLCVFIGSCDFYPVAGRGGRIAACQRVCSCPFRRLHLVVIGLSDCLCLIGQNNCLRHPKKK